MSDAHMSPAPGSRLVLHVGDRVRFVAALPGGRPAGARAFLRTDLGRARQRLDAIIAARRSPEAADRIFAGAAWHDIELAPDGDGWAIDLPLTETGFFLAKAYIRLADGTQCWPGGDDVGLGVHPDAYRTGNTIYCAFVRMFGATRGQPSTRVPMAEEVAAGLDRAGWTAIPPSGTFRDLAAQVPHIVDRLACRILHLLPVTTTPTTQARFGRFGSPYAGQGLTRIDPALAVFDQRSTAVEQFRELADAVHLKGARLVLDIVINHTGWFSELYEDHPEWFRRDADGRFHSPGAWGNTWADLVELDHRFPQVWAAIAEALLTWCRRGVDGFRCDAGYMVPLPAWQYIIARVRREFPEALFLLEGLGGGWEATEALLTTGGMQWAYSELFQNYRGDEVARYLDHCIAQGARTGVLVHYSETHDNDRLAKGGRAWSLLRNRLCALTSLQGAFGFTCGVEWLAAEKLDVHQCRGLNWDAPVHIVAELAQLNRLLGGHPCFHDGAVLTRLSPVDGAVLALRRDSAAGDDRVLVLINTDPATAQAVALPRADWDAVAPRLDLVGDTPPRIEVGADAVLATLAPGAAHCLAATPQPLGLAGDAYRRARAQAAWAYQALSARLDPAGIGPASWRELAELVAADPERFLAALTTLDAALARTDLLAALRAPAAAVPPAVSSWRCADASRVLPVPSGHWLLIRDDAPFAAALERPGRAPLRVRSVPVADGHAAAIPPQPGDGAAELELERFCDQGRRRRGALRLLPAEPAAAAPAGAGTVLLTNGRGAMARLAVDLGAVRSKYDCLLGANLHPTAPCDRHVLAKRLRVWANADGFITALDRHHLAVVEPGPPARWRFAAPAGDGRTVPIEVAVDLLDGRNTVVIRLRRGPGAAAWGAPLEDAAQVRLTVRIDVEDRSFHGETRHDDGLAAAWAQATTALPGKPGFRFAPAADRVLTCAADRGVWHPAGEWSLGLSHAVEAERGLADRGDAWSPGWFDLPLKPDEEAVIVLDAEPVPPAAGAIAIGGAARMAALTQAVTRAALSDGDALGARLVRAVQAYVARRGDGRTVIAGYPWFLDWGRDTLIAARGLIAAGLAEEVRAILATFAALERGGTLPNMLGGDDDSNRDTIDAPLWLAVAAEDAAAALGDAVWATPCGARPLATVLRDIAGAWLAGTANGISVDHDSALVWGPAHFTWMDTNHPACTPRAGYAIEIQALWIRLLRLLDRLDAGAAGSPWRALAARATASLDRFWLEDRGWFADQLAAPDGQAAAAAEPDDALRPNQLIAIALGVLDGPRARRAVAAAERHLVVPGAVRSLAPLPVSLPLANRAHDGRLLNDPQHPYWGGYTGDEDTRRKPAYHNGTAWVWLYPVFCEALCRAWDATPAARAAARAWLVGIEPLLADGCLEQLPEILDGDAPHAQRGCDAQAWSVSEALRVWRLLDPRSGG